ncbi:MAG: PhoH-like ATPase [Sphingobacteriales bacterium]|jgi:PhoH-like ATPase
MPAKATSKSKKKIFVLDSSVVLHDHNSVKNFEEHDVAIPITVLEEIDNFKKGHLTINFEAREFIRYVDELSADHSLEEWIPLAGKNKGKFKVQMHHSPKMDAEKILGERKNDHKILNAALSLHDEFPDRPVILVSKDINLRIKAKALNLQSEDYETGKIKDIDMLYKGKGVIDASDEDVNILFKSGGLGIEGLTKEEPVANQYFILRGPSKSALCYYNPEEKLLQLVEKRTAYGIEPRNAEQAFALHAILNPNVSLVSLQGVAGTGKTLITLAAAIEQKSDYAQIYLARPIVPLSNKDLGFLPGDIKAKINPYMEPLWDNLKFIQNQFKESDKNFKKITDMVDNEKLMITPLAYIRGRSLSNIIFIVDEAQNLTPHEIKTIITRAGEGTKIIFTGDINQIDTPFLDNQSNGLSYMIDKLQGQPLYAHVTLEKGERSELANMANDLL